MRKKRGISPVIATVLLVGMVIVIALIIFLWFRGMTQETIKKFGDENIELACDDVMFEAAYSTGTLTLSNTGNVPIFDMKLKISDESGHTTETLSVEDDTFTGLNQGGAGEYTVDVGSANELIVTPVLLGTANGERRSFVCDADQYGYQIFL